MKIIGNNKIYSDWDEAFKALSPATRIQSVRIASYTKALYGVALSNNFYKNNKKYEKYMSSKYLDTSYKCGLYHQLGKAFIQEKYQVYSDSFTKEQKQEYRLYTKEGRLLIANLQELNRDKEFDYNNGKELPTDNIPWTLIRDAASSHMERYDGNGYPNKLVGDNIPPIAQIVSLAKYFDFYCSENNSEHPFEDALEEVYLQENKMFSPELIAIMKKSERKCREIYEKYIDYTLTIKKTIHLVDKRNGRPLGLEYLKLFDKENKIIGYKAIPFFKEINDVVDKVKIDDIKESLNRTDSLFDVYNYLLYELTDCLLRFKNCGLDYYLIIDLPNEIYYNPKFILTYLLNIFAIQEVDLNKAIFTIDAEFLLNGNKTLKDKIQTLSRNHVNLLLKNYQLETMSLIDVQNYGFNYIGFDSKYDGMDTLANLIKDYNSIGIKTLVECADTKDKINWYTNNDAHFILDINSSSLISEDEIIEESLKQIRNNLKY